LIRFIDDLVVAYFLGHPVGYSVSRLALQAVRRVELK